VQTKGFTDNALNPVTAHCITHLPVYADTQTTVGLLTGQINKCKPIAAQSLATPVYLIKLPGLPEKTGFGEPVPLHLSSSGQPLTPLGTPALDYCLAGTGPHAGPKSMCTFTFDVTGLESSLTHNIIPLNVKGLLRNSRHQLCRDSSHWFGSTRHCVWTTILQYVGNEEMHIYRSELAILL